ncbi:pilus assembly FimT family protein [Persephonella sp.]
MVREIKGFSLIEMLVVIALVAILAVIAGIPFLDKMKANKIESDIRRMYGLLQEGRMKAFGEKTALKFVVYPSDKVACIEDAATSNAIKCVDLNFDKFNQITINIDKRGTFTNGTIVYSGSKSGEVFNCISISNIRVKMGVWNGSDCQVK